MEEDSLTGSGLAVVKQLRKLATRVERDTKRYKQDVDKLKLNNQKLRQENRTSVAKVSDLEDTLATANSLVKSLKAQLEEKEKALKKVKVIASRKITGLKFTVAKLKETTTHGVTESSSSTNHIKEEKVASVDDTTERSSSLQQYKKGSDQEVLFDRNKFIAAARNGQVDLVERTLQYDFESEVGRLNGSTSGSSGLSVEADPLVEVLSAALYQVLEKGKSSCSVKSFERTVSLLLDFGATPLLPSEQNSENLGSSGRSCLHLAALRNNLFVLEKIAPFYSTRSTQELDIVDQKGYTPFHLACKFRKLLAIRFLMEKGADMEKKIPEGLAGPDLFSKTSSFSLSVPGDELQNSPLRNAHSLFLNYTKRGVQMNRVGRLIQARYLFEKAVLVSENNRRISAQDRSRLHFNKASVLMKVGALVESAEDLHKAIALDGTYVRAKEVLAECCFKLFRFKECISLTKELLEPRSSEAGQRRKWQTQMKRAQIGYGLRVWFLLF